MKSLFILSLLFLFVFSLPAQADFKFVGKIPAPEADAGCTRVTGLAVSGGNLAVTVKCDTSSFLFLLDPTDGTIIEEKELDGSPPDCPEDSLRLISMAYEGFGHYWLGDSCGNFINVIWVFDSLAVYESFLSDTIPVPSGLCYQNDTLFAVDYSAGLLAAHDLSGNVLSADSLPPIDSPTALALYRDHFFLSSASNDSLIFEITKQATMIDTHFVEGLAGTFPLGATFYGGQLYVGSDQDSILIFEPTTYNTCVGPGDNVTVEVVPGRMAITFDSLDNWCCVQVDIADSQACPPPDSVEFFSDVYHITTCLRFDLIARIALEHEFDLPSQPESVRIFSRPSGACTTFRDITVDSMEVIPILRVRGRMQSEDDEFSMFAVGVDGRNQGGVIERKFVYTRDAITSNQDSIPPGVYDQLIALLDSAQTEFFDGFPLVAAVIVDSLADLAGDTPGIPHTYYPGEQGHNIAGMIMSSAHTLRFSLIWIGSSGGIPGVVEDADIRLVLRPNPSSGSVAIEFECGGIQPVNVSIYSVRGRLVRRLFKDHVPKRRASLTWQGDNENGHRVSPGTYFVVVSQGDKVAAKKIILQR
jgi:hypothetical protein